MIDSNPNRTKIHRLRFILSCSLRVFPPSSSTTTPTYRALTYNHTHTHTHSNTQQIPWKSGCTRSEHQGKCHQQRYTERLDYMAMFRHQPVAVTLCTCSCCWCCCAAPITLWALCRRFSATELIPRIFWCESEHSSTVQIVWKHQIQTHPTPYSFVSVNVHAAPPLWHGIFSASAIGGKLSIASLLKQITLPSLLYELNGIHVLVLLLSLWRLMCECCAFPCRCACRSHRMLERTKCTFVHEKLTKPNSTEHRIQPENRSLLSPCHSHSLILTSSHSPARAENKTMADDVDTVLIVSHNGGELLNFSNE